MCTWAEFETKAPAFAAAARRLFIGTDGVAIGFLATVSPEGEPHLAPVCPIFTDKGIYLSAASATPKIRDLRTNRHFALHAFLDESDEEIQLRGLASEIIDESARAAVHAAIKFGAFDRDHPIFSFDIAGAVWVYWENAGQPDTRAIRQIWHEDAA